MKRHGTDGVSLTFALIFLGLSAWWLVDRYVSIDVPNLGWVLAVGLIVVGLLGVAMSLRNGRREPVSGAPAAPLVDADTVDDVER
jgi:hypothetical protein